MHVEFTRSLVKTLKIISIGRGIYEKFVILLEALTLALIQYQITKYLWGERYLNVGRHLNFCELLYPFNGILYIHYFFALFQKGS